MNRHRMPPVTLAVLLSSVLGAAAQQHPNPEAYAKGLEDRERVAEIQVDRVVAALQLAPGMTVADLGSGLEDLMDTAAAIKVARVVRSTVIMKS